jgi:hypothetical protein
VKPALLHRGLFFTLALITCTSFPSAALDRQTAAKNHINAAQVPSWSSDDLNFFLHGSMGTEIVPEAVLRAFIHTYPDLFPTPDLSHLGLIADPDFGWPSALVVTR